MSYLKQELYELIKSDSTIFDFIQDASLDGFWYWDIENPVNEWINPRFWKTLGYDAHEIPAKPSAWQQMVYPGDLLPVLDSFSKHQEIENPTREHILRYMHKNGSTVWMRCKGMVIRNKEGKATRMLAAHIDITKEKETEERLRLIFDSIDEGFCIIEMIFDEHQKPIDYRFLTVNASFERQTGMANAVGKRMREFAPNHEEHWFEIYGKIALTGESIRFENRAEQLSRWYDVYAFRFGDPQTKQVAILFNDITARKEGEQTIQLLNKNLIENLLETESVNKDLESFTYSVSHDLRAPLRSINGYASMLRTEFSKDMSGEAKRFVEEILKNSRRMGHLIDDLLTFARLGRKEVTRNEVDVENMVKSIIEEFRTPLHNTKTVFNTGTLLPAYGDSALIKQVWVNLLSNAFKYSHNHQLPVVEVGSHKTGNEITYFVKDNGVGFDMEHYSKLFGIFQRLHSDEEFEGTGVGLAIVQKIVNRHGGKVWAEAVVDKGACFYFTLPVVES